MATSQPTQHTATATAGEPTELLVDCFASRLSTIIDTAGHGEMWGVQLKDAGHVPTSIVLTKYLRANNGDLAAAEKQLTSALEWRKEIRPASLVEETFDQDKFGDLGYVTSHPHDSGSKTIISWNIYGAVKSNKNTFGDVQEFIKWRTALMEYSVRQLNLTQATERIPDEGEDPYQMIQVHDYLSVSFFRPDPVVKKASQEAIRVFSLAYPELLAHKYFVNVPALMGWMYALMKLFVAPSTLKKFHPMNSGTTLASELPDLAATLPKEYGGQGPSVKEGETVKLGAKSPAAPEATTEITEQGQPASKPSAADSNGLAECEDAHALNGQKTTNFDNVPQHDPSSGDAVTKSAPAAASSPDATEAGSASASDKQGGPGASTVDGKSSEGDVKETAG